MSKITWLDLYNFLHDQANNINKVGNFNWDTPVVIHDADTGDENNCDVYILGDSNGKDKFVLMYNVENIYSENK